MSGQQQPIPRSKSSVWINSARLLLKGTACDRCPKISKVEKSRKLRKIEKSKTLEKSNSRCVLSFPLPFLLFDFFNFLTFWVLLGVLQIDGFSELRLTGSVMICRMILCILTVAHHKFAKSTVCILASIGPGISFWLNVLQNIMKGHTCKKHDVFKPAPHVA